jgi:tRNA modification GTPase
MAGVRELRHPASGDLLDEALVIRFDGPASSTGDNVVELQCHGGRAVIDAVLGALTSCEGLRPAEPGEFTRRAFENGRIDLTEAEGLADLLEAETETQRKAALAVAEGGLRKQVAVWQDQLLGLSAQAERAIDYDDEDAAIDPVLVRGCAQLADDLRSWLDRPRAERLKDGVRVVVAGPPNSGKSSLVNALAGEDRAIVTAIPGTTRDHIEVPLSLGGVPILLTDTAGLRETGDQVEAIGIDRSSKLIEAADIVVWLGDSRESPTTRGAWIRVHSKADLGGRIPDGALPVSSISRTGLAELTAVITKAARAVLPTEGAVALNRRQAQQLSEAAEALTEAEAQRDVVLLAESLRFARGAFDRITGRAGVEDVLDALFSRFCLGK